MAGSTRARAPRFGAARRRRPAQRITAILLALLIAVPVAIAALHQGFPAADVEMRGRDVWVTNANDERAGRLNAQISEIDASLSLDSDRMDVLQDGEDVFVHDIGGGTLGRVDPMYLDLRERIAVPTDSVSAYGGDTLAILERSSGRLWILDATLPLTFDAAGSNPVLTLGPNAQIAVSQGGAVFAASPDGGVFRIPKLGAEPVQVELGEGKFTDFELTAVGETPVVFDKGENRVLLEGKNVVSLDAIGVRAQLPGPEADHVVIAGADGFIQVPLHGGAPAQVTWPGPEGTATDRLSVARPAVVEGCVYGAWAATREVVIACGSGPEAPAPRVAELPPRDEAGELVFRVNRDLVALNDVASGNVWMPQEDLRFVENWEDTVPPEDEQGQDGQQDATEQSFEDTLAERTDENHPPQLEDDSFGARPGGSSYLPVLDNDTDPDGDLITVSALAAQIPAEVGTLRVVDQGRAFQLDAAPGATGEYTVTYQGTDGRPNGVAEARLTIRIVAGENGAPMQRHRATVTVEAGQTIRYNVLPDWQDPEGDPVYLLSATEPGGSRVTTSPDGMLTFEAVGAELGERLVTYTVSDGTTQATGELAVQVAAPQSLKPVATPDFARGLAGDMVTMEPLINDLSPSGSALQLVEISELGGGAGGASFNPDKQTVSYKTDLPGTYYVQYTVKGSSGETKGLIRFDIADPAKIEPSLAAVRDVAYLRPGQPATVSPLVNDEHLGAGVVSVKSVTTTDQALVAGLAIELLDNATVRVSTANALQAPVEIPYTATDGVRTADGVIVVMPVEPSTAHHPPLAVDDVRTVRVGDYTSVDVLANDVHPDGTPMTLESTLGDLVVGDGFAFVSGDQVRFQAPKEPGTYGVSYLVTDEYGEQAGARVTFHVTAMDEASNRPPAPSDETARVYEGASIRVNVPLSGVDADGDSVTFSDIVGLPTLGSIREQDETSFLYEAFPGSQGTDTLTYEVVDTYGARGVGTIRIGVVERPSDTAPPVAVDDLLDAKPGTIVSVPVLDNDSDPNGYRVSVVEDLSAIDPALEPRLDGSSLVFKVPADLPFFSVPYTITNGHGGTDEAYVHVTVTPEAPERSPSAVDHVVALSAFDGVDFVDVPLRDGATNPSGLVAELEVQAAGVNAGAAEITSDGSLRVRPTDRRQVFAYTLTDPVTERTASAFVLVPALIKEESKRQSPYLRTDLPAQIANVGQTLRWNVGDLVIAPSGLPVRIIDAQAAWAEQGDGSPIVTGDTTLQFTPRPGFRGPASITFLVSDAQGPDDTLAGVATIRVPITVGDPNFHDVAPTFVTPRISLPVGETKSFDLASATGHPNQAVVPQVQFSGLQGGAAGVTARLSGSTLNLEAARQVRVGEVVKLTVTYAFREFVQTGTISVTITSSPKPPPRVVDDTALGLRGQALVVNVTRNDFNPYPDAPLKITEAKEVSATATGAKVTVSGTGEIRIEPNQSFIGEITIQYSVLDDTRDPLRTATGYLRVKIRDVPSAPGNARLDGSGAGQLTVAWDGAESNGEPITAYEVTLTPSGTGAAPITRQTGVGTTLTLGQADGIRNGVAYSATVRALNSIGWGPLSAPSPSVVPKSKPTAPQNVAVSSAYTKPGAKTGDLVVTWQPPSDDGGGVKEYTVTIVSPSVPNSKLTVSGTTLTATLTGLPVQTATQYQVTVTATNEKGSETSLPAVGTLTYMAEPAIVLRQGAFIGDIPYFANLTAPAYQYELYGRDFVADATYQVKCFTGKDEIKGEYYYTGASLNSVVVPDCVAIGGNYSVEVWLVNPGNKKDELIARSNTIPAWTKP
ncbi:hypothetical protein USB125703_01171 [Pseudoclavibacter triregionum]|nr:hypothetical protein USB125703_01171 [Pseudoclavibacter triregionum]